jgi:hypothetical protein
MPGEVCDDIRVSPGLVLVTEQFDDDDDDVCSGLWSAHWQSGDQWRHGPEGVSAQEAIAWGRRQADVVIVEAADSDVRYSASAGTGAASELPAWPEGRELPRRRATGMEHLDRSDAAEPISWRVESGGSFPESRLADFIRAYGTSLQHDAAIDAVLIAPHAVGQGRYACEFAVLAATAAEAESKALSAADRAFEEAFDALQHRISDPLAYSPPIKVDTCIHPPVPAGERTDRGL